VVDRSRFTSITGAARGIGQALGSRLRRRGPSGGSRAQEATLADFVIIGFPKCGTSALTRAIGTLQKVQIDRYIGGELEAPYFAGEEQLGALRTLRQKSPHAAAVGHKFSAYVYDNAAMRRIAATVPGATLVACVRDPKRALVSWREMHRRIAVQGIRKTHFVNLSDESRRFYAEASLEDYYRHYARDWLTYAAHIERLRQHAPRQPLVLVSQEYMAARMDRVLQELAKRLNVPVPPSKPGAWTAHRGVGDDLEPVGLSDESRAELTAERVKLNALLDAWREHPGVGVLADGFADAAG